MRKTFLRALVITAAIQFAITRHFAGTVVEEGRAERMWAMYPLNVVMNALAWTLMLTAAGRAVRAVRRIV
ncbi:MAG TPA: hypothetical protein VIE40_02325 [Dehalococcoidia bacterium]|jgi:hypothetical protein